MLEGKEWFWLPSITFVDKEEFNGYVSEEISKKRKAELYVYIFSYWIYYVAPGCIVHLPLTTVGVCVDPVGVGQACVDANVHLVNFICAPQPKASPN